MSAWEFIGLTEQEYDDKYFNKKPIPENCAFPGCKNIHTDNKHFCLYHFEQLQKYIHLKSSIHKEQSTVEAKEKVER